MPSALSALQDLSSPLSAQRRVQSAPAISDSTSTTTSNARISVPATSISTSNTPKRYSRGGHHHHHSQSQQRPRQAQGNRTSVTRHALSADLLHRIYSLPGNHCCADCGRSDERPGWASVSHGAVLCISCCGVHRSLGVVKSFIKSLTLDSWTDAQIKNMMVGGNSKLADYFKTCGIDKLCQQSGLRSSRTRNGGLARMSIAQKYSSTAAEYYRLCIVSARNGVSPPAQPPQHTLLMASSSPNLLQSARLEAQSLARPGKREKTRKKTRSKRLRVVKDKSHIEVSIPAPTFSTDPGKSNRTTILISAKPVVEHGTSEDTGVITDPVSPSVLKKRKTRAARKPRCSGTNRPGLLVDTEPATLTSTCSKICVALYDAVKMTLAKCTEEDSSNWGTNTPFHCLAREVERASANGSPR